MSSDQNEIIVAQLAQILIRTDHQLNALYRIQRILIVIALAIVIFAVVMCWPFLISLVSLGLGLIVIALKFLTDTWPYFFAVSACYLLLMLWLEHRPDAASRLRNANFMRIEKIRKKRDEQMEADMAAYFEEIRANHLKAKTDIDKSDQWAKT